MKRFTSDALVTAGSHACAAVSLLLLQAIMVRFLSRNSYGAFALAQSFVLIFESIFVPRSGEIALQLIGKAWYHEPGKVVFLTNRLRSEEMYWNLTIFGLLTFAAFLLANHFKVNPLLVVGLSLAIPFQSGFGVSKAVIIGAYKIRQQSQFEIAISILTLLAMGLGVWFLGLIGAVIGYVLVAGIKTTWAHLWANKLISNYCLADSKYKVEVKELVLHRLSAIAVWRNGCQALTNQVDVFIIGSALGNETVALYKSAKTFAAMPSRIVAPIWGAMRPRLMDAIHNDDTKRLVRLIVAPGLSLLVLGIVSYPLLRLVSPSLFGLIYTRAYLDAVKPMLILTIGGWVLTAASGWLGFVAIIVERKIITTILFTLNAAIIVIGGFFLHRNIICMAAVVCSASIITSVVAWYWLISSFQLKSGRTGY